MTKKASVRYNFPATKVIFIFAMKPDTEYDNDGVYQVTLVYDAEQGAKIKAEIEALDPSFAGLCRYTETEDGSILFKVKQKRFIRWLDRKTQERQEVEMKPIVLNADNTAYTGAEPWGGTIAEVGVVAETQAGANRKGTILALRFRGMRIHELVTGTAGEDVDPMFGGPIDSPEDDDNGFGPAVGTYEEPMCGNEDDDEDAPI